MSVSRLQTLVLPHLGFGAPEDMYVRLSGRTPRCLLSEGLIELDLGDSHSFDTFFNGISTSIWKRNCLISDMALKLSGAGRVLVRFGLHRIGFAHRWLDEQTITLSEDGSHVAMAFWPDVDHGLLYLSVVALEDGVRVSGGFFETRTPPERDVRLGIVITHFNRREFVLPAIRRISEGLLNTAPFDEKVELVIIDNSQNIRADEAVGATLIPSRNLGGSGGFMRGLLHLEDSKSFTHCLFMDDDASCEIESLKRAFMLLSYATTPNFAVSGALLREIEPYRLFEKGARFPGYCRPLKSGLDMRSVEDLLESERVHEAPDYGAWWFFAFALADVKSYAFPFFVRGDDILFSLMNRFRICTMNGVACWGDDFALKSSPLYTYFDARYHLIILMTHLDASRWKAVRFIRSFFLAQAYTHLYASACAVSLALDHVTAGPKFWADNLDMSAVRSHISAIPSEEKMVHGDRSLHVFAEPHSQRSLFDRLSRKISLHGMLLPDMLLRNRVLLQHKGASINKRTIWRFNKIYYEYEPLVRGFVATRNRRRFFSEYSTFLVRLWRFWQSFDRIKAGYQRNLPILTSRDFWRDTFDKDGPPSRSPR